MEESLTETPNTIELWVKVDQNEKREHVLVANAGVRISVVANGNLSIKIGEFSAVTTGVNMFDGSWHHLAITRDITAEKVNFYLDGVENKVWNNPYPAPDSNSENTPYTFGAKTQDYLGRVIPNDVIVQSTASVNATFMKNDSVSIGTDKNKEISIDFYSSNNYTYSVTPKKFVRLISDPETSRLFVYTADSVENIALAHDIVLAISN